MKKNNKKRVREEEAKPFSFNQLPLSIFKDILSFLPIKDCVLQAALVCKAWRDTLMPAQAAQIELKQSVVRKKSKVEFAYRYGNHFFMMKTMPPELLNIVATVFCMFFHRAGESPLEGIKTYIAALGNDYKGNDRDILNFKINKPPEVERPFPFLGCSSHAKTVDDYMKYDLGYILQSITPAEQMLVLNKFLDYMKLSEKGQDNLPMIKDWYGSPLEFSLYAYKWYNALALLKAKNYPIGIEIDTRTNCSLYQIIQVDISKYPDKRAQLIDLLDCLNPPKILEVESQSFTP